MQILSKGTGKFTIIKQGVLLFPTDLCLSFPTQKSNFQHQDVNILLLTS